MVTDRQEAARHRALVVDDEETIRHILVNVLEENGCETRAAGSAEEAIAVLPNYIPDVALLDIVLPGKSGLELLAHLKKMSPDTEVVMITSHASAETALQATREGAYAYLRKPFEDLEEIWVTVQRALEKRALMRKNRALVREQEERTLTLSSKLPLAAEPAAGMSRSSADLIEFFMDMVTRELRIESACLMLLDDPSSVLRVAASRGLPAEAARSAAVNAGEGIAGSVAVSGEPYLASGSRKKGGARRPPAAHPSEGFFGAPIGLCVAVRTEQRILGALVVGRRKGGGTLGDGDVAHLSALGGQLAVAMEGARRADELQRAYESLKATQDQLVFSERLKAIGQMASGVAHDFNNGLSVILARAQFMRANLEQGPPDVARLRADLDIIVKTAHKGAQTIKRIQEYTRVRKDTPQAAVDLDAAVKDAIEISRPKWKQEAQARGRTIDVQADLPGIPSVTGNVYELTQVVENLIFNAVEAMPNGGRITVRTRPAGEQVVLEVSDTGTGMSEEVRKRLFEPFFTTKEYGQGLGTSIVFNIVQRHRGRIEVKSAVGQGTTFTIHLPRHVAAVPQAAPAATAPRPAARSARVLLVDDEGPVRDAYAEALRADGHDVQIAIHGEEALILFDKQPFDLVITDLSMGGISGLEVAKRVKELRPSIPVILLTGWAVEQREERVREARIEAVLTKPCRLEELASAVQEALRAPVGS